MVNSRVRDGSFMGAGAFVTTRYKYWASNCVPVRGVPWGHDAGWKAQIENKPAGCGPINGSSDQGLATGVFCTGVALGFLVLGVAVGLAAAGLTAGGVTGCVLGIGLALAQRDATIRSSPPR